VLAALGHAKDVVATEELNYPGIPLLGKLYDLDLVGVPVDHQGLRADALDHLCQRQRVSFLLCSPTMHNPTTITMSAARRKELVDVARKRGLTIIENDILGMMPTETLPSLASLAPERCCYLTGLSKLVATGLRLGFVVAPETMLGSVTTALHSTTWMPPPLMSEIFTLLVEDGSIGRIIDWHRSEAKVRAALARQLLTPTGASVSTANYYAWLRLPGRWTEQAFVEAARAKRVFVTPGHSFAVARHAAVPGAVRIGLGSVNSRERVESGLRTLAALVAAGPPRSARKAR
jgi:DNA-binding transcriptional MocR family regulator